MFGQSKDRTVVELVNQARRLEGELAEARMAASRMVSENEALRRTIEWYKRITEYRAIAFDEKSAELENLKTKLAALALKNQDLGCRNSRQVDQLIVGDATIAKLREELEAANGEIKKLRATITEQDGRIHELRGRVEARNDMLAKQSDVVTKLEQAQEHLGVQVQARDQKIAYLNSAVAMNERAISAGASALGNKEATIRQCEAIIASLREEIESCKNMISAQDSGLTSLRAKLSEKDQEIEGQKVRLANYSSELDALVILRMKLNTKDGEIESHKSTHRVAVENIRKLADENERLMKLLKEKETLLAMQQQTICKREDEIRNLEDASPFATIRYYEDQINALKAERDRLKTDLDGVWSAKEDLTKQFIAIKKVKEEFARRVLVLTKDCYELKEGHGKLIKLHEAAEAHIGRRDREAHELKSVVLRHQAETDKLIKCVNAQARTIADQKSIIATLSTVIETYIRN